MHDIIHRWAYEQRIAPLAIADLLQRLGVGFDMPQGSITTEMSEAAVQQRVRIAAGNAGILTWRNNVGVMQDDKGSFVRYGLANETAAMNKNIKSADLIGIKPVRLPDGRVIGQFWSREVKHGGWRFMGDDHERAQLKWQQIVIAAGGDAAFTTGAI